MPLCEHLTRAAEHFRVLLTERNSLAGIMHWYLASIYFHLGQRENEQAAVVLARDKAPDDPLAAEFAPLSSGGTP
jgi:hypothetical protein